MRGNFPLENAVHGIRNALGTVTVLLFAAMCVAAQDTTTGGIDSIVPGPYGVPVMVVNEGGGWDVPIKVFEDSTTEIFIPNITQPGWVQSHVEQFRKFGTYFTYAYIYGKEKRSIHRYLFRVDTRKNVVIVDRPLLVSLQIDIANSQGSFAKSVAKITAIATGEFQRFHGQTTEEVIEIQKRSVAKMALCSGLDMANPDCNLSDAELEKKYPQYPRRPPQLIPGATPGVNCGVGTDRSCCCANSEVASNAPAERSGSIAQAFGPAPGAIICPDFNALSVVYTLYGHRQERLQQGHIDPKIDPGRYGCSIAQPGIKLNVRLLGTETHVDAILPGGREIHGLTMSEMVSPRQP